DHDVLIVGGGIVGCTLASRLATNPTTSALRVALVEGHPPRAPPSFPGPGGAGGDSLAHPPPPRDLDPRVYSLTPASVRLLEEVGVWGRDRVAERSEAFWGMQVL
ncbi:unnamed protein product, partial [Discosporangium mesarthrocarpum]